MKYFIFPQVSAAMQCFLFIEKVNEFCTENGKNVSFKTRENSNRPYDTYTIPIELRNYLINPDKTISDIQKKCEVKNLINLVQTSNLTHSFKSTPNAELNIIGNGLDKYIHYLFSSFAKNNPIEYLAANKDKLMYTLTNLTNIVNKAETLKKQLTDYGQGKMNI